MELVLYSSGQVLNVSNRGLLLLHKSTTDYDKTFIVKGAVSHHIVYYSVISPQHCVVELLLFFLSFCTLIW